MNNLSNKKILITGGCGFIGSNIAIKLLKYPISKIIIIDNLFSGFYDNISNITDKRLNFVKGDIRDYELMLGLVGEVDIVCHQAAWGSVPRSLSQPKDYHDNNVTGFFNVLEAARVSGVKRVVYASSSSVYGSSEELPKVEGRIGEALAPYGLTKYMDELYANIYRRCYGMEVIGLRYFNVFGPMQNPDGVYAAVIPKFIESILVGRELVVNGDGSHSRDFTYIDNVVDFNLRCFMTENEEVFGKVFNVACGKSYSLNNLVDILRGKMGVDVKVRYESEREGDIRNSLAEIDLGERLLGYKVLVDFEEGIEKTIEYFKEKNNEKIFYEKY